MMSFRPARTLLVLLTFSAVFHNAGGKFTADPTTIEIGLTPKLTMKCEFVYSQLLRRGTNSVQSMVLSFKSSPNHTLEEVAAVSWDLGAQVHHNSSHGNLTVDGKLSNNGSSFITLVWNNPGDSQSGIYFCTLFGWDYYKKPVMTRNAIEIQALVADATIFGREIRGLQGTTDQLQHDIDDLQQTIDKMRETVDQLEQIPAPLRQQLNGIEALYEKSKEVMTRAAIAFFHISGVFKGSPGKVMKARYYYLSKIYVDNRIHTAEGICQAFGGYLAEINDFKEYRFVQSFMRKFSGIKAVYIGGTDEAKEGTFILQHSKMPVSQAYVDMYNGQPNGGKDQNCMALYGSFRWRMADENCYVGTKNYRFLCEVPLP